MNMARRSFIGVALALAGCGAAVVPPRAAPSAADDIASRYRFPATAPFETWSRHLNQSSLERSPVMLALSGGGEDGAFGAGLLNGLAERGEYPVADVVTGVSTGALMAPLAFLGPSGMPDMRQVYTRHGANDILRSRGPTGLLDDALYSSEPLAALIEQYLTSERLDEIAAEHLRGRRLFVVTSNLDTSQAVAWNMGAIAADRQYGLFRAATLASASIPGVFPPVSLRFELDSQVIRETHIDGGVNMQLLAVPDAAFRRVDGFNLSGGEMYVIVNNTLTPRPRVVPRRTLAILSQSLTTLNRSSADANVDSARRFADRARLAFHAAAIEPDAPVTYDPNERFSLEYMRPLFEYGYQRARSGRAWGMTGGAFD